MPHPAAPAPAPVPAAPGRTPARTAAGRWRGSEGNGACRTPRGAWLGARRLAGTRVTRLCGAAPRSRQPRLPRLALLQPAARIDRVAVAAQLEVQRRASLAAG